jgi:3-deoxy-D-manno-octulosonic-acid transferase
MAWLLNCVYLLLLAAFSPVVVWRMLTAGKYRNGWGEKLLGRLPELSPSRGRIWFHAVSVGEVLQLRSVLPALLARRPDLDGREIVITTTTVTGHAVAREHFPSHTVCYFPLDFSWAVRRAVRRIQPAAVVLVELELWPNFIRAVSDAGVPLVLINGRISERSHRGYRRIRPLMRSLLLRFDVLAVQSETYAERLVDLGAPPERIAVTGSVKFDGVRTDRANPQTAEIGRSFGLTTDDVAFIAGSTQAPEEEMALETWLALRDEFPRLRLILVPRHKERFEEVARLVERRGLPLVRRSGARGKGRAESGKRKAESGKPDLEPGPKSRLSAFGFPLSSASLAPRPSHLAPVFLLDTLGELGACWGLATVAYVGGSMHVGRGGQNMIEPSGYGAAVLFGPDTRNFRDVVELLRTADAAHVVPSPADLTLIVRELLTDRNQAAELGRRAQAVVLAQQGATARTVELILSVIVLNAPSVRAA